MVFDWQTFLSPHFYFGNSFEYGGVIGEPSAQLLSFNAALRRHRHY